MGNLCFTDAGHLRPLREADAGQRGAAEGRVGVPGLRTTPRQPPRQMEAAWKNSAVLGSCQRPNYQGERLAVCRLTTSFKTPLVREGQRSEAHALSKGD